MELEAVDLPDKLVQGIVELKLGQEVLETSLKQAQVF